MDENTHQSRAASSHPTVPVKIPGTRPVTDPLAQAPANAEPDRDAVTTGRLIAGDPEGLRRLLQDHGGLIQARLRRDFGKALDDAEIDEAMGAMAVKVWNAASRFDATKGTLRAWATVIARNCALRQLERRRSNTLRSEPDLDRFVLPEPAAGRPSCEQLRLRADLHASIAALPPLQRAVLEADLEAGGSVPAESLAARLGSTPNSIYVSRQKARQALRQAMALRGHDLGSPEPGARRAAGAPIPLQTGSELG